MLIATHSGLRGLPGQSLTDRVVADAIGGLAELLRQRRAPQVIALARDPRPGGRRVAAVAADAASSRGLDVVDLAVTSTPAAKLFARRHGLGGAVVVTGSHLDPAWNGLKLVAAPDWWPVDPRGLPAAGEDECGPRGGVRHDTSAAGEHASAVCAAVDADAIRAARLRVEWSGSAGDAPALVLEALGCAAPGGPTNVGLRFDPDGDRLVLSDERGAYLDPEATFPLMARATGAREIVAGADTSRMIDEVARAQGGSVRRVAPGELHLVSALATRGGDLAGEGNGGVVDPRVGIARDGLAAAAAILELIAVSGRPLSELAAELPRLSRRRSTVPCADHAQAARALEAVARSLDVAPCDPYRGVFVETSSSWALVRRSATEPVLRISVEADDEPSAESLHDELRAALSAR